MCFWPKNKIENINYRSEDIGKYYLSSWGECGDVLYKNDYKNEPKNIQLREMGIICDMSEISKSYCNSTKNRLSGIKSKQREY